MGAEHFDVNGVAGENLGNFLDDADPVVADQRELQPALAAIRGADGHRLGNFRRDAQSLEPGELGFERRNIRRGQFDADDASEFPGKVRHRRLEPVAIMPADGAGQAFDEAGPVVPNDGQDKRDGRSIHGVLSSDGVNTIGSARKYSTAIFSGWQHD